MKWISQARPRWASVIPVLLLCLLVAPGCTTNPATGEQSFTAFMSPEQERRVGAEEHPKLVRQMGGRYGDPALARYVADVGNRVAAASDAPDVAYSFTVIDSDDVNAFALPGGYVHVTRGLLALANSEAELAGVLAHEIGHIVARHAAERYSRSVAVSLGSVVLGALGAAAGLPVDAGSLAAAGGQAYLQSYSREQEMDADMLGVRYLTRAGYDPRAMASFLEDLDAYARLQATLAGRSEATRDLDIMASHPRTADRIRQAMQLASREPRRADGADPIGRKAYLTQIDGLIYGDSPEQGLRVGQNFYHPTLRIAFRVPPGFSMLNRTDQVIARNPSGALVAFDIADSQSREPLMYLRGWGKRINLTRLQTLTVNGMSAATGVARIRAGGGLADLRVVAIAAPDRLFRFIFLTPPALTGRLARDFERTTFSFRRLTEAEAAAVQPLRIRVAVVGPADTVRSLAATMPFGDLQEARFRVLNDLDPGQSLAPGRPVKLITGGISGRR